jgi:hypothetical protein
MHHAGVGRIGSESGRGWQVRVGSGTGRAALCAAIAGLATAARVAVRRARPIGPDLTDPAPRLPLPAALALAVARAFAAVSWAAPEFRGDTAAPLPPAEARLPIQPVTRAAAIWGTIDAGLIARAAFGRRARATAPDGQPHR